MGVSLGTPRVLLTRAPDNTGPLALVGLPGRELVGDPVGAAAALHPSSELGVAIAKLGDETLAPRRHGDLVAISLDGPYHRPGDLLRSGGPDAGRGTGLRVVEHAGLPHEPRRDDRHADPMGMHVLAETEGEAAQAELGRVVEGGPG